MRYNIALNILDLAVHWIYSRCFRQLTTDTHGFRTIKIQIIPRPNSREDHTTLHHRNQSTRRGLSNRPNSHNYTTLHKQR